MIAFFIIYASHAITTTNPNLIAAFLIPVGIWGDGLARTGPSCGVIGGCGWVYR